MPLFSSVNLEKKHSKVRDPDRVISVASASLHTMTFDIFGLLLINFGERVICSSLSVEQFVQLRLQSLSVAMLSALNEQGHKPNDQRRHRVPVERISIENKPKQRVHNQNPERTRMRGYFCVHGGLQSPFVLGSRSGLAPLTAGAQFTCSAGVVPIRFVHSSFDWNKDPNILRIIDGLQADWFDIDSFLDQEYRVSPTSNRMGLRLQGQPLVFPPRELLSEPVSPGAVQVTRDGQCIILGVDGQSIGGYPKIAHVITVDLGHAAQLQPLDEVRFELIELEEARALLRDRERDAALFRAGLEARFG